MNDEQTHSVSALVEHRGETYSVTGIVYWESDIRGAEYRVECDPPEGTDVSEWSSDRIDEYESDACAALLKVFGKGKST